MQITMKAVGDVGIFIWCERNSDNWMLSWKWQIKTRYHTSLCNDTYKDHGDATIAAFRQLHTHVRIHNENIGYPKIEQLKDGEMIFRLDEDPQPAPVKPQLKRRKTDG